MSVNNQSETSINCNQLVSEIYKMAREEEIRKKNLYYKLNFLNAWSMSFNKIKQHPYVSLRLGTRF